MREIPRLNLNRQGRLIGWLKQEGITQAEIARSLSASEQTVSRWIRSDSIPSWRHRQLVAFGIPEELLPPAIDIPSGPKKKKIENLPALPSSIPCAAL